MTDSPWPTLAREHGPACVIRPGISDALLNDETDRQKSELAAMLRPLLAGELGSVLDYGCGYGRFSPWLATLCDAPVLAYDPCAEMIVKAPVHPRVSYASNSALLTAGYPYGLVFCFGVLGNPGIDLEATAAELVTLTAKGGLLVIVDHMPEHSPEGRWWQFRPAGLYLDLFARHGIRMQKIGETMQLNDTMSVLAGRREERA